MPKGLKKGAGDLRIFFVRKDRKNDDAVKIMNLDVVLFMKRFLLHVLPNGFVRIRHYGFLGNPNKKNLWVLCRKFLGVLDDFQEEKNLPESWQDLMKIIIGKDPSICPVCNKGRLVQRNKIWPSEESIIRSG